MDESNETEIISIAQLLGSLILLERKKRCQSQIQMNQKMVNKWKNKNQCHQLKQSLLFLKWVISEIKAFLVLSKGATIWPHKYSGLQPRGTNIAFFGNEKGQY